MQFSTKLAQALGEVVDKASDEDRKRIRDLLRDYEERYAVSWRNLRSIPFARNLLDGLKDGLGGPDSQ